MRIQISMLQLRDSLETCTSSLKNFKMRTLRPYNFVIFLIVWLCTGVGTTSGQSLKFRLRQSTTCGRLQVIRGDVRTLTPWTAAIFVKNGNSKRFFTNGIIIGPTTVLSVAGGPFGETLRASKNPEYTIPNPATFFIVAGINSTDSGNFDEFAQTSQISVVEPHRGHDFGNEHYHYFIYHLKTPLNFETPYVKDICLPLFLMTTRQSPYGLKIVQSGFALSAKGNEAQALKVWPIISGIKETCESVFRYHYKRDLETSHAFCGKTDFANTTHWASGYLKNIQATAEDSQSCHLHSASLLFNIPNIWYLGSLVTAIPGRSKGRCSNKSYYIYGDILRHLAWMERSYRCSPNKYSCQDSTCIPWSSVCDGVKNCKAGEDEDIKYCSAQSRCFSESIKKNTTHSCGLGQRCISKFQLCDGNTDCENKNDEAESICNNKPALALQERRRKSNCVPAPDIQGALKNCFDPEAKTEDLDCNQATFPGAIVSYKCTKFTTSHYTYDNISMECDPEGSGEWVGRRPFSCDADCGVWTEISKEQYPGFPWFVHIRALFQQYHRVVCSGTLIESRFVLTSTKCIGPYLTKDITDLQVYTKPTSVSYKSFNQNVTSIISTKSIFLSDGTLQTVKSSTGLTIIQLADPVIINQDGKPVPACYNSPPFKKPGYGKIGLVAGFGVGDTPYPNERLSVQQGVVVPESECDQAGIHPTSRTQFCVIFNQGNGICKEDAGGGIYFQEKIGDKMQYVLRGAAEPMEEELCARTNYVLFTNVNSYSDWLMDVLETNS